MKKIIISILSLVVLVTLVSGIFFVSAVPTDKENIEKITFIHYKDGKVKAIDHNAKPGTNTCYKLMGVKWNTLSVNYVINPANDDGLSKEFVTSTISTSAETWDDAISKELFNNNYEIDYSAQYGVQNYRNAIVFGDYPSDNVIAVTSVWYNRFTKKIVEFDMLFNTRFTWGVDGSSDKMDLQNIATHELGHSVGLADIYTSACSAVTMYGYSNYGDISKRTLELADVTGLRTLYGI
ncbi:MAG: matrixin family metalloprotease [Nanoarchaeota archaeon]|nr:matrixin family metalloprotease [Nanoarchaeota archaeon]